MHWCDLSRCGAEGCRLSGERPMISCHGCGALVVRTVSFGLCVECIDIEIESPRQEA
jgi:hypothetical protein